MHTAPIRSSCWGTRIGRSASAATPPSSGARCSSTGSPTRSSASSRRSFTGVYALVEFDAYMPFGMMFPETTYRETIARRDNHDLRVIGRLKPGVSLAQAQAGVDVAGAAARAAVSGHQQDGARARDSRAPGASRTELRRQQPVRRRRLHAAGRPGAARGLRQRRQPDDGARDGPPARAGASGRARRRALAAGPTAAHREPAALGRRRRSRARASAGGSAACCRA